MMSLPSELVRDSGGGGAAAAVTAQTKVKFSSKALAAAARPVRAVTRLHCYFAAQDTVHVFVLHMALKSGMTRTHTLGYEDAEILQPLFRREQSPFQLAMEPAMLHKVLERMHGTDEMSVLISPSVVQFQSFHEGGNDATTRACGVGCGVGWEGRVGGEG